MTYHQIQNTDRDNADAIILLGDVTAGKDLAASFDALKCQFIETYTIVGNHENWDEVDDIVDGNKRVENLEIIIMSIMSLKSRGRSCIVCLTPKMAF